MKSLKTNGYGTQNQSSVEGGGEYTYFDSVTRKYLDKRKKNELKCKQIQEEKERKELAACTFRPVLASQKYYSKNRQCLAPSTQQPIVSARQPHDKTPQTYQRLLNWGTQQQHQKRAKLIQRQIDQLNLSLSLSKDKIHNKLNHSLEETLRSDDNDSATRSITAVPLPSREELTKTYYRTFQDSKRQK